MTEISFSLNQRDVDANNSSQKSFSDILVNQQNLDNQVAAGIEVEVIIDPPPLGPETPQIGELLPSSERPIYHDVMSTVLSNVIFFDETPHDHQSLALFRSEEFKEEMRSRDNVALLHSDMHSDVITIIPSNDPQDVVIATHIGPTLLENPQITDFIWLTRESIFNLGSDSNDNSDFDFRLTGTNSGLIYINNRTEILTYFREPDDYNENSSDYRIVNYQKVTEENLPSLEGRNVIWNSDMDYFSNTGHDTIEDIAHVYQGEQDVLNLFENLERAQIRPFALTTSLSPFYTSAETADEMMRISAYMQEYSGGNTEVYDAFSTYFYHLPYKINDYAGENIPRLSDAPGHDPVHQAQWDLSKLDLGTTNPDRNIALSFSSEENPEYREALDIVKRIYNLETLSDAEQILQYLDTRDGRDDDVVTVRTDWKQFETRFRILVDNLSLDYNEIDIDTLGSLELVLQFEAYLEARNNLEDQSVDFGEALVTSKTETGFDFDLLGVGSPVVLSTKSGIFDYKPKAIPIDIFEQLAGNLDSITSQLSRVAVNIDDVYGVLHNGNNKYTVVLKDNSRVTSKGIRIFQTNEGIYSLSYNDATKEGYLTEFGINPDDVTLTSLSEVAVNDPQLLADLGIDASVRPETEAFADDQSSVLTFVRAGSDITLDLNNGTPNPELEIVTGSNFDDTITTRTNPDSVDGQQPIYLGGGGNDKITGAAGTAEIIFGDYDPGIEDGFLARAEPYYENFGIDPNNLPEGNDTITLGQLDAGDQVYAGPGDDVVIVDGVTPQFGANGDIVGFVVPEGTVLDGGDGTDTLVLQLEDGVQLATTGRILPEALENLGTDFEQVQVQIGTPISLPAIDAETEIDYENSNSDDYLLDDVEDGTYIRNNPGGFLRPDLLVPSDGYRGINGSPPYGDDLVAELRSRRESIETEGDEALFEGPPVLSGSLVTKLDSLTVGETYSFKFSWQQIREVFPEQNYEYYGGGITVRIGDKEVQISSDQTPAEHEWTEETIFFVAEAEEVFVEISASEQEIFSDPTHRGGIVLIDIPGGNNAPALSLTPLVTSLTSSEITNAQEDIRVAQINIEDDGLGVNALSLSSDGPFEIVSTEDGDFVVLKAGSSLGAGTQLDFEVIVDDPEIGDGPEDSISGSVSIVSADDQAPGEGEPGDGEDSNDGSDDGDNTEASPPVPTATGDPMVPLFDEAGYLAGNPDVAAAVEAGTVESGLAHFITFGLSEGRDPFELFDTAYYLEQYPDVAAAIEAGTIGSAFEHYIQFGQFENRNPSALFNATDYLAANLDVAVAVENGTLASAFEHYITFGATEGRDGTPELV